MPGVAVEVIQRFPSHLIRVGHAHFTIVGILYQIDDNTPLMPRKADAFGG